MPTVLVGIIFVNHHTGCRGQCAKANDRPQNMTDAEFKTEFSMLALVALIFHTSLFNTAQVGHFCVASRFYCSHYELHC